MDNIIPVRRVYLSEALDEAGLLVARARVARGLQILQVNTQALYLSVTSKGDYSASVENSQDNGGFLQLTVTGHQFVSGDRITLTGYSNSSVDDWHTITVNDANTITLDDVSYVAGSGGEVVRHARVKQVSLI